ncbi:MAG: NFACT family protein [Firmicutes bacterium]|nr:NFACT family protein [Bacillota bacterium]
MPFDGMVMAAITRELAGTLTGCRIDRIYQPAREEVHLILSRPGAKYRLLLSADPGTARIHITGAGAENPPSPPVFCMVLRKHLEGGRIYGFSQPGYDRVLTIAVDTRDDLGRPSLKHIICEIMGKHSNIILLDPGAGIILDGIKRYSHTVSRHREVLPGRRYIPPPAGDKINPLSLGDEEFFGIMLENGLNSRVRDIIQKRFDGQPSL